MTGIGAGKQLVGKVVLCVEDENLISRMYSKGLCLAGAKVLEASDGNKALSLLKSQRVDIILLDLEMPNLNGFDMLKVLREMPQFDHLPILVMSNALSITEAETNTWLMKMGVARVILKCDVSLVSLIDYIQAAVEKSVTKRVVKL